MARARLSDDVIAKRLSTLEGFRYDGGKLVRRFQFADFVQAFGWMSSVALVAERLDHHPEWKNVYGRVDVELSTHDSGGVTELDFDLAAHMIQLARGRAS